LKAASSTKTQPRVDTYEVVARALESGIARGIKRGRKSKTKGGLGDAIFRAAMDELSQVIRLE
jgi:hypothetical protein